MIVVDETKRKAFNQAKKALTEQRLMNRNKDFSLDDVIEIKADKRLVLMLNNGDY